MTDLFTAPPARPVIRMTPAQQALVNLLAQWALDVLADNKAPIEAQIAAILPAAARDVPEIMDPVLQAADHVADCAARRLPRGHKDWWDAQLRTSSALIAFFGIRAVAAWRAHEEAQVIDPVHPAVPATGAPAHAQP